MPAVPGTPSYNNAFAQPLSYGSAFATTPFDIIPVTPIEAWVTTLLMALPMAWRPAKAAQASILTDFPDVKVRLQEDPGVSNITSATCAPSYG